MLRDAWRTWSRLGKEGRWSSKSWSQDSRNGLSGSCNGQTKRALGRDQAEHYREDLSKAEHSRTERLPLHPVKWESRPDQVSTVAWD